GRRLERGQEALPARVPEPDRRGRRLPRARREEHRGDRADPAARPRGAAREDGHATRGHAACARADREGGLRPGVRSATAQARAPEGHREPGLEADPRRALRPEGRDPGRLRGRPLHLRARRPLTRGGGQAGCASSNIASIRSSCRRARVRFALALSSTAWTARPGLRGTLRSRRWWPPSVIAASGTAWPRPRPRLAAIMAAISAVPCVESSTPPGFAPACAIDRPVWMSKTQQLMTPLRSL